MGAEITEKMTAPKRYPILNTYVNALSMEESVAEIEKIVYDSDYNDPLAKELLEETGIEMVKYKREIKK